ncbi:hypothetical protein FJU30_10770 [Affinibrenneria salicis]|uniref:Uncharacterized protein n=1 Tax=Affinibrenneria salicis TaxID=2590031 RepID=A0A5J5G286_9GAMM|nr:hypothetical protein [Affinibrenneria salicis]KAA9000689.1 hypothetical protein FJU30_10770 [Affinibrenneria salicis]
MKKKIRRLLVGVVLSVLLALLAIYTDFYFSHKNVSIAVIVIGSMCLVDALFWRRGSGWKKSRSFWRAISPAGLIR